MKRKIAIAAAVALCAAVIGAQAAAGAGTDAFVSVQDAHFVRKGQPYVITGANFWYGGYLGAATGVGQRARLVKELDRLKALGINNVRVLAVSEQTDMKSAVRPATTRKPGDYDENLLAGLDFLMAELAKRDMTAVLYLNNFWQWSGGMTQYLNWFEGTPAHDPNATKDYERFIGENARFYTDAKAQAEYHRVIEHIVERTNTVTGKPYREDPAILSWQLANEPRPGNSKAGAAEKANYVKWVADTAHYIRSLDARHMVSSGSEGLAGSVQDAQLYMDAHRTPDIAYLTYHLWPANWGWFDPKKPDQTWNGMMDKSLHYLNQHIDYARQLHKPIVLEEFGLNRDGGSFDLKASTTVRDRFYGEVFGLIEKRAAAGDPVGGWTFWAWGGAGRAANADYWWKPGNDFVGDPPQEEQGLYSVFDSDAGSLQLIQDSARRLQAIGAKRSDGLAMTPQMGWNSWNRFGCNIDEKLIRETADAMVRIGLKDAGYQYINIDDCWHGQRDADGNIQADPQRFPNGIKAVADYVHARGLKLGIYSDVGDTTCGHRPGSRGHEYQDARTYAAWGVDYLKYDWCDSKGLNAVGAYTTMRDALRAANRPILFSICEWGDNKPWEWAPEVGQSWRTTGDIYPCWDCEMSHGAWSQWGVLRILDKQAGLRKYSGPGHWNDMDMLEVGMGMSEIEDRAHFSIWAMLDSPLILGNDLRSMPESTRRIIANRDIIGINQDPLGVQALRFYNQGQVELWAKPMAGDEWALMILNRGEAALPWRYDWQHPISDDLSKREVDFKKTTYQWKDAWSGQTGDTAHRLEVTVPAHGVVVLRLKKGDRT